LRTGSAPSARADCYKLKNVKATLAVLVFGHEGLRALQPLSDRMLRQPCTTPRLHEEFEEAVVIR
jgi:hypothetical protein